MSDAPIPFATTPAERLATIVNSFLRGAGYEGRMGSLQIVDRAAGRIFLVTPADGPKCAVWPTVSGWSVSRFTADNNPLPPCRSPDLETAARMALGEESRS